LRDTTSEAGTGAVGTSDALAARDAFEQRLVLVELLAHALALHIDARLGAGEVVLVSFGGLALEAKRLFRRHVGRRADRVRGNA